MNIRKLPFARPGYRLLMYCQRQIDWLRMRLKTPRSGLVPFRCNICGGGNLELPESFGREKANCRHCGSTVRSRSMIHALSMTLFGKSLAIPDFPVRRDLFGVGMTDFYPYASRLAKKLSYTNTYYHMEPRLDIMATPITAGNEYDFILSSDVFEHLCQPISKALGNAVYLLKPGGSMIFSVPYQPGETIEHYPEVCSFSIALEGDRWILTGKTADGRTQRFENLVFHGGPGTTVEMRVFGKDSLVQACYSAGFDSVRIHDETVEEFGIHWKDLLAHPLVLTKKR